MCAEISERISSGLGGGGEPERLSTAFQRESMLSGHLRGSARAHHREDATGASGTVAHSHSVAGGVTSVETESAATSAGVSVAILRRA